MSDLYVGHGVKVTLNFELRLENGEVVDSTFAGKPGVFDFGDGTLPAGFEELLRGMGVGEKKVFEVLPEKAFGMPNPQNVQRFKPEVFEHVETLEPGMVLSFADAANSELPGVIAEITEDEIVVDFNHPLAGRTLTFEAEIVALAEADVTAE